MFANSHKRDQKYGDVIFQNHNEAIQRAEEIGAENVINGTIGALLDKGSLVTFPPVDRLIKELDIKQVSAYAPQQGYPDFIEAVKHFCFGDYAPEAGTAGVAVAGGMGGIRQAIVNYTEIGDSVITADWYWGPYKGLAEDNYRQLETFEMFHQNEFNLESFKEKVMAVSKKQDSLFIMINSPANNPTGYSLTMAEWDGIIDYLNSFDRNILLLIDSAYLDFSPTEDKQFFHKLDDLKDNILTIIDYSFSKSFAKYGMRTAALLAVHRDERVLQEFCDIITISNRACYGSVNSMGQLLAMELYKNQRALKHYRDEFNQWKNVLRRRADTFMKTINPEIVTPYKNGFFVSIKSENGEEDVAKLKEEHIFLVPMKLGIRVALCSVEEKRLTSLAEGINRVLG
jgi:aromatic-amino-acid transaminase